MTYSHNCNNCLVAATISFGALYPSLLFLPCPSMHSTHKNTLRLPQGTHCTPSTSEATVRPQAWKSKERGDASREAESSWKGHCPQPPWGDCKVSLCNLLCYFGLTYVRFFSLASRRTVTKITPAGSSWQKFLLSGS